MSAFVRGDELLASWKVVSKFLRQIDAGELAGPRRGVWVPELQHQLDDCEEGDDGHW